jgi:uncharacterized membrane protein
MWWVIAGWLLFGGTHVLLPATRLRQRLGALVYTWVYLVIASVSFAALVWAYAGAAASGPRGLALADVPALRGIGYSVSAASVVLMAGALSPRAYWGSPAMVLMSAVRPAVGLERVSRHPFFAGLAIFASTHALLATHLSGTIFFLGFVVLIAVGASHQTHKLRARYGAAYEEYLRSTSAIPLLAIVTGRQRLVISELPWIGFMAGGAVVVALRYAHPYFLAWHGALLSALVIGFSALVGIVATRREAS